MVCITCGEEFDLTLNKPGLATECLECTVENPSLKVQEEVRVAMFNELKKSNIRFRDHLPRGLQMSWKQRYRR